MSYSEEVKKAIRQLLEKEKISLDIVENLDKEEVILLKELMQKGLLEESLELLDELVIDEDWAFVKKRLEDLKPVKKIGARYLKYAAVFVAFLGLSYAFLYNRTATPLNPTEDTSNAITLKTGDQKVEVIKQGDEQQLTTSDGTILGVQKGNTLVYKKDTKIETLVYSQLTVPYGKTFNLELSDGSIVHLNAGSSIKFPVKFLKNENREVFLYGEAYFKVAKNTESPFIVNADDVMVEVLGTEFNVSAYAEDITVNTVLVEGSVELNSAVNADNKVRLSPGLLGAFHKENNSIDTEKVDLELHVGWIKGELVFRNVAFSNIIKKIERRYDVTIVNENKELNEKLLNARFHVNIESIEDVLQNISDVTPFNYTVKGNKVIITN